MPHRASLLVIAFLASCGSDDASEAGTGGQGGTADAAATGGTAGSGGSAGAAAGAGMSGAAGSGGNAGAGSAGVAGMGGTAGAVGDAGAAGGGNATCADAFGARVCSGTLDPTALGAGLEAVKVGLQQMPGEHFYCYPEQAANHNGRLLIHLVGTGSNPARDNSFGLRACALGYAAISPMYENSNDMRSVCADQSACYEAHHREILYGTPGAPDPVDVDVPNSIMNRAATLLAALEQSETRFPPWSAHRAAWVLQNWSSFALSGHSQGSAHALYLARDFAAERLILLAGPADRLFSGQPNHAPVGWITNYAATPPKTEPSRYYEYISADDGLQVVAQVVDNIDRVGVAGTGCSFDNAGNYQAACRRVTIPALGCGSVAAHIAVAVEKFSNGCIGGIGPNTNAATWEFLLTN